MVDLSELTRDGVDSMNRRTFFLSMGRAALTQIALTSQHRGGVGDAPSFRPGDAATGLPGRYFRLMDAGSAQVQGQLPEPVAARRSGHYDPGALMVAAVLYSKQHSENRHYRDSSLLTLSCKLGDQLAEECETGRYARREDNHRDTYMWLEAYRLLLPVLEEQRQARWGRELSKLLTTIATATAWRQERPAYTAPFGVSPNHTSLFTSTLYLAGHTFGNREWVQLAGTVMHRFAKEQSPDGYWGEHVNALPTTAYDYLTAAGVALYYEYSRDPAALAALRRSLDFHEYFTYLDGQPVMEVSDRRRHAYVSPWAQFGYSNFPDGRRYAKFLTSFYNPGKVGLEHLGRVAQDALYYHEGPEAPIPQDKPRYSRQLSVPAGIRRTGPWVVCLSGLISTQAVTTKYYLDRQGSLGVFHQDLGLIITGANSKRQPELATLMEKIWGQVYPFPLDSRLSMNDAMDRLSVVYNTFWSDLEVPPPADQHLQFRFKVEPRPAWARPHGQPEEARLTLQLCLKAGEALQTGAGQSIMLGSDRVVLGLPGLGGWIRHHGWTLRVLGEATLTWPVYPFNPYADAPETDLKYAVGALAVPLHVSQATIEEIGFILETGDINPPSCAIPGSARPA